MWCGVKVETRDGKAQIMKWPSYSGQAPRACCLTALALPVAWFTACIMTPFEFMWNLFYGVGPIADRFQTTYSVQQLSTPIQRRARFARRLMSSHAQQGALLHMGPQLYLCSASQTYVRQSAAKHPLPKQARPARQTGRPCKRAERARGARASRARGVGGGGRAGGAHRCTRPLAVAAASSGRRGCTALRGAMAVWKLLPRAAACTPRTSNTSTCARRAPPCEGPARAPAAAAAARAAGRDHVRCAHGRPAAGPHCRPSGRLWLPFCVLMYRSTPPQDTSAHRAGQHTVSLPPGRHEQAICCTARDERPAVLGNSRAAPGPAGMQRRGRLGAAPCVSCCQR